MTTEVNSRCYAASQEVLETINSRLHLPPNTGDSRVEHAWVVESSDPLVLASGDIPHYVVAARIVGTGSDVRKYGVWVSAGGTALTAPLNQTAIDFEDSDLLHAGYSDGVLMTMDNVEGADIALSCVEADWKAGA